jgi:hypothetical protein
LILRWQILDRAGDVHLEQVQHKVLTITDDIGGAGVTRMMPLCEVTRHAPYPRPRLPRLPEPSTGGHQESDEDAPDLSSSTGMARLGAGVDVLYAGAGK